MNLDNLHELIQRYEDNLDMLRGSEHYELFKWEAFKCWRQEWYKPQDAFPSFAERFNAARKHFALIMDNSRMHPSTGVIKLWEKEPETVEKLFGEVLFADADRDASAVQNKMDAFVEQYEELRQKYFASNWSFKQDRHSTSVFLAMDDPEFNYIYKSSDALMMAKYIDFGFDIGSGNSFNLDHYYRMCDGITEALREHQSLLEKHSSKLTDRCYADDSLHIMTFDLIYCCKTYGFYQGLVAPSTGKAVRKRKPSSLQAMTPEEKQEKERKRREEIQNIQAEITSLEHTIDEVEDISLLNVQVFSDKYGPGIVTEQNVNKIRVRFAEMEKSFMLHRKYAARPRFENDDEIINAFTAYVDAQDKIAKLQRQIRMLEQM